MSDTWDKGIWSINSNMSDEDEERNQAIAAFNEVRPFGQDYEQILNKYSVWAKRYEKVSHHIFSQLCMS